MILIVCYFIIRWIINIVLTSYEKKAIKRETLGLKSKSSVKLRFNIFKTNVGDVKTRIKSARKGFLIFIKVLFFIIFIVILIHPWYKDLTALFASAGIITVIVTMGAHTILGDYFSGFLFIFEDHYNVGEIVKIGEVKGRIISANLKKICVESFSGERHYFLHSQIKHIVNYSKGDNKATIIVEVAYETDIRFALKVLQEQLELKWKENHHIKSAPVILVIHSFNQSGVAIRLYAIVEKEMQWEVERWLILEIFEIFKKHKIEIPYAKMVIHQAEKK